MNPSAPGWIAKHLPVFEKRIVNPKFSDKDYYEKLREIGFVYANSISTISYPDGATFELTLEEMTKVNLFDSLGFIFFKIYPEASNTDFINRTIEFYNFLQSQNRFDFHFGFIKSRPKADLEKIIHHRVRINENFLERSFSTLISNALLFLDVLTFEHFLKNDINPCGYATSLEALIGNTVFQAFKLKDEKDDQDELVLKLMENSIRYNRSGDFSLTLDDLDYSLFRLPEERHYILDTACMAVFFDKEIDDKERDFILKLGKTLELSEEETRQALINIRAFYKKHKEDITYLDDSNPIKNLYDNTTEMVSQLIVRNKKRLIKEISGSRELMELLAKSSTTDLTDEEKSKVKTQLLDIVKMVPSLAIFLLPFGSILLPIMVSIIPDMLPSGFKDNKI